ncbi:MAG: CBM35 domain-containing protein, partial [Opitutales bacterium]
MKTYRKIFVVPAFALLLAPAVPAQADAIREFYSVETIEPPEGVVAEVGGVDFMPDGRLVVVFERGEVYTYDVEAGEWSEFAAGLHTPLGVVAVSESEVVVSQRAEVTRLRDTSGDGVADHYEVLTDAIGMSGNYHEFHFGPTRDAEGNFYIGLNLASQGAGIRHEIRGEYSEEGRPGRMYSAVPYRGWVMQITPAGEMRPWAPGFRSPNGLGFDAKGNLFVTDNEGDWLGTSKLHHVEQGKFYGHPGSLAWQPGIEGRPLDIPHAELDRMRTKPVVQFPHGIMSNSPTQPIHDSTNGAFGPFSGQLFVGEMNRPRIMRVMLEEVAGSLQGAVVPFYDDAGLQMGNNRLAFAPDGSLWVGQTHREQGWAGAPGLQRITWKKEVPLDVFAMNLTESGFDLTFTRPVDPVTGGNRDSYAFRRYFYRYDAAYGSPQLGVQAVPVDQATVSEDGRTVSLALDNLVPGHIYELTLNGLIGEAGDAPVNTLIAYTLNRLLDGTEELPPEKMVLEGDQGIFEAEEAEMRGPSPATNHSGYTGSGFVSYHNNSGDFVEWTIDVENGGEFDFRFRYALESGNRPLRLVVNE